MNGGGGGCARRDLVAGRWAFLLWCMPTLVIIGGAFLPHGRAALWIPSFTLMGVACLVNARGCRRRHCRITGPLFLVAAFATTLDAVALVSISWKTILAGAGVGTIFAYSLEWLRGKYVETHIP